VTLDREEIDMPQITFTVTVPQAKEIATALGLAPGATADDVKAAIAAWLKNCVKNCRERVASEAARVAALTVEDEFAGI
jgi:hypothetical protein